MIWIICHKKRPPNRRAFPEKGRVEPKDPNPVRRSAEKGFHLRHDIVGGDAEFLVKLTGRGGGPEAGHAHEGLFRFAATLAQKPAIPATSTHSGFDADAHRTCGQNLRLPSASAST